MDKDFFPWSQNPATFPIDMNFYTTSSNWDQHDPFESALSSMVSSPAASSNPTAGCGGDGGGGVQLVELIGKLGSICSPSEISPHYSTFIPINQSGNNSCYSTPLNSPPKLDLSNQLPSSLTPFATDPGFAERAARFSCFGNRSFNGRSQRSVNDATEMSKLHRVASCNLPRSQTQPDSKDESSVSQKLQSNEAIGGGGTGGRKRKSAPRAKAKEIQSSKVGAESNDSGTKRTKSNEMEKSEKSAGKENSNPPEPPKDYIHVRARRGQATDSHSLAERVRREKISERMKFLQDLVPGCNKVTGKAVMLDEIINYVQSLQRQVEFLSMKLATVNPRMDNVHMESLLSKEILQTRGNMYPVTSSSSASAAAAAFTYAYNSQEPHMPNASSESQFCNNLSINGFSNAGSQVSMWGDELHNVVQMGFGSSSMEPSVIKMEP